MITYIRAQRGKVALLLGGLVIGYAAATWARFDPMNFDPWAVD